MSIHDPRFAYVTSLDSTRPNYLREKFRKIVREQEAAKKRQQETEEETQRKVSKIGRK